MTMLGHDHHDHDHDHDHAHGPGGHQHHAPPAGFDGAFVPLARFDLPKRGPATAFPSNLAIQSPPTFSPVFLNHATKPDLDF
jgi:hypothetical protein